MQIRYTISRADLKEENFSTSASIIIDNCKKKTNFAQLVKVLAELLIYR